MSTFTSPLQEMEIVNTLLADASEKGYITYDQILEGLPQVKNNQALLEMILEELQAADVAVYETEEDASDC